MGGVTGSLVPPSEQQLVVCSKQNSGCNGGLLDSAFTFYTNTAIAAESSYPYNVRYGTYKTSFTTAIPQVVSLATRVCQVLPVC